MLYIPWTFGILKKIGVTNFFPGYLQQSDPFGGYCFVTSFWSEDLLAQWCWTAILEDHGLKYQMDAGCVWGGGGGGEALSKYRENASAECWAQNSNLICKVMFAWLRSLPWSFSWSDGHQHSNEGNFTPQKVIAKLLPFSHDKDFRSKQTDVSELTNS